MLDDVQNESVRATVSEGVGEVVIDEEVVPVGEAVEELVSTLDTEAVPDFVPDGDAVRVIVVDSDGVPEVDGVFEIEAFIDPVGVGVTSFEASIDLVEVTVLEEVDEPVGEILGVTEDVGDDVDELVPEGVIPDVCELVIEILGFLLGDEPGDNK